MIYLLLNWPVDREVYYDDDLQCIVSTRTRCHWLWSQLEPKVGAGCPKQLTIHFCSVSFLLTDFTNFLPLRGQALPEL